MWRVSNFFRIISSLAFLLLVAVNPAWALKSPGQLPVSNPRMPAGIQANIQPIYFPLIFGADPFLRDAPIWAHSQSPDAHEVALFRHTFTLRERTSNARMAIFADTRYQVWLDGLFIGSGPARFSSTLREYDVLPLGEMLPGSHQVSVLVQWAPNQRRGESISPYVQAHIEGEVRGQYSLLTRTSSEWLSSRSEAWRSDAVQVHTWGLIGSTELVDLRKLPNNWFQPGFDDSGWTPAAVVDPGFDREPKLIYRPRSIDLLDHVEITPALNDAGYLSPGFIFGEISPPFNEPVALKFSSPSTAHLSVETLATTEQPTSPIRLDGQVLNWQFIGSSRPDVITTTITVVPGEHSFLFEDMPPAGTTFGVSAAGLADLLIPFSQGVNAGRRLLLSEPVSNPRAITVLPGQGLNLEMSSLPAYFVLDLGRTVHGRVQARVSGPSGTILDIGWDERLLPGTKRPLPFPGTAHPQWSQVDSWVLDGKARQVSTIDVRAGRYILFAAWGTGPVTLEKIAIREERYPVKNQGGFQSTDPLLNQVWQVGMDSLYPNRTDAYTDTPWRERGQWWGDAYVSSQIEQATFGDLKLLKRGLSLIADEFQHTSAPGFAPNGGVTHMLDYSMLWVLSLSDYQRLSGDREFIVQAYSTVQKFMAHLESYENSATGLLDLPQGNWSNTAYIESLGFESRFGQSTAMNALYYRSLAQAAGLAEETGDLDSAQKWEEKSVQVRQSANNLLYIPAEGRYATTLYEGQLYSPTPQAQAWALVYGLTPAGSSNQVAVSMLSLLSADPSKPNLDVYGMYWLLQALGETGHIEEALDIIGNYYGRLLDLGATTWWENFNADQNLSASYSHAWGGSPTWFLTTYLLGARRSGPEEWLVAPALRGVASASGSIPIGDHLLKVRWERRSCQSASISVQSDSPTRGEILLPSGELLTRLWMNGTLVWENGSSRAAGTFAAKDGLHIPVQSGSYSLIAEYNCEGKASQP